jgi:hypothetical protein
MDGHKMDLPQITLITKSDTPPLRSKRISLEAAIRRLRDVHRVATSDRCSSYDLHQILTATKTVCTALEYAFARAARLERSLCSYGLLDDEEAELKPFGGAS